jgi:hypothetical protein
MPLCPSPLDSIGREGIVDVNLMKRDGIKNLTELEEEGIRNQ